MIRRAFAIFDVKAKIYFMPQFFLTTEEAIRTFADVVSDKNSVIGKHPEDFLLFDVGNFCQLRGKLECIEPHCIASGSEYVVTPVAAV